ncbi:MAG: hypothetical protein NT013_03205 [Planctomycetia bacterium]|nr:hypothetical protein [Planctomycetia bacterium]
MKRITSLLMATAVLSCLPGCCCLAPFFGGCGTGCNTGCNTGCAPGYGGGQQMMAPQGTTYQSYDSVTGIPMQNTTAYQPIVGTPVVSLGPLEALPTYH